ncbi:unnamed protein product [Oncorhynchus mykiss]|uniref:XK-related protein n=1 Tax=Oncorhynchus mykiss TaxID=8022 RepID=A0A060VXX1_ONCMY|nr:unnamed protein product [Oncorhynchus mykiss]
MHFPQKLRKHKKGVFYISVMRQYTTSRDRGGSCVACCQVCVFAFTAFLIVAERTALIYCFVYYLWVGHNYCYGHWAGLTALFLLPGWGPQLLSWLWYQADGRICSKDLKWTHILHLGIFRSHSECSLLVNKNCLMWPVILEFPNTTVLRRPHPSPLKQFETVCAYIMIVCDFWPSARVCEDKKILEATPKIRSRSLRRFDGIVLSWPNVLRMTQILIFTKSAASVCMMAICIYSRIGWCLESLFFLCQPWLPARKHVPSSLLCTKRASQARILLPVRLHLNQPFIGSSRTSRRAVQLFCGIGAPPVQSLLRNGSRGLPGDTAMFIENALLLLAGSDFFSVASWDSMGIPAAVFCSFLIGVIALVLYYRFLHPKSFEIFQSIRHHGMGGACAVRGSSLSLEEKSHRHSQLVGGGNLLELPSQWQGWKHHHWLLIRLAMKTGDVARISHAYGEGGLVRLLGLEEETLPRSPDIPQRSLNVPQDSPISATYCSPTPSSPKYPDYRHIDSNVVTSNTEGSSSAGSLDARRDSSPERSPSLLLGMGSPQRNFNPTESGTALYFSTDAVSPSSGSYLGWGSELSPISTYRRPYRIREPLFTSTPRQEPRAVPEEPGPSPSTTATTTTHARKQLVHLLISVWTFKCILVHKHALECYLNAWLDKEIISACLVETTASAAMAVSLIALSVYARHNEWKGALQFPASCIVYIFFFFFLPTFTV